MSNQPIKAFKVYQASAGSGKTFTIIKEYLALCLKSKSTTGNYSQILAITFTNMAANEMKAKILKHIVNIINSDPEKAPENMEELLINELGISRRELKENAQLLFSNILHDYSNFFICTIDAFVQRLARSFAKELGLPTRFNISIDEEDVADDITERIGEQIGSDDKYLTSIIEDFAESKLEGEKPPKIANEIHEFIKTLFSEGSFNKSSVNPFKDEANYKDTIAFVNSKVKSFEVHCQQFVKDFDAFLTKYMLNTDDFYGRTRSVCLSIHRNLGKKIYPTPSTTLLNILDGNTDWHSNTLPNQRGEATMNQINEAFEQAFSKHIRYYHDNLGAYHFYKSQRDKLSLYVLRSKLRSELEAYIGEEQVVHISEFNKRINQILGDFSVPFVYEHLGARLKHVFIDEFQDTSVLQWQNLIPLINNGIASGHLSMVVGDGKQSIYRWRNGEVEQIVSLPLIPIKPEGSKDAFHEFERNLIANFNYNELKRNFRSFQNIIDFNYDFFESSLKYLSKDWQKVYFDEHNPFGKDVTIKQFYKHDEPGYVQIELFDPNEDADNAMLGRIKELIEDLSHKGFSKSDITILVRRNRTGSLIAEYLSKNGIEVVSADSILLKSSSKVRLIISTLDYLIHTDNAVSIASLLYYWNVARQNPFSGVADGFFTLANAIAKGQTDIEPLLGLEKGTFKSLMVSSYSLYDLCSALMRLYGFNAAGDTYLSFLLDVVYQWQLADETGIGNFLEYWDKKKNKLNVLSGKNDAVNVMTIHKSKGLEFNVVICPFVTDNIDDKKTPVIWASQKELGFEAIPNIDEVQISLTKDSATWTKEVADLVKEENDKVRLDNMNLNYVAFTRAVQRLHILSYKTKSNERSPLNAFLEEHPDHYGDPDTCKVIIEEEVSESVEFYHESQSGEWLNKISIDSNPSMFWVNPEDKMKPQEWGDFVHQLLSEIKDTNDIEPTLKPYLESGVIDRLTANMLSRLFLKTATHPKISEAFSTTAKVKNECDILLANGQIRRPDRYAELPDKVILLDYKTGKPSQKHQEQLNEYVTVLSHIVTKPIEAFLVYLGEEVEIVQVHSIK